MLSLLSPCPRSHSSNQHGLGGMPDSKDHEVSTQLPVPSQSARYAQECQPERASGWITPRSRWAPLTYSGLRLQAGWPNCAITWLQWQPSKGSP